MIKKDEEISIRQLTLLFIMITFSPAIRIFPQMSAIKAGEACWLAPLAAFAITIVWLFIIHSLFRNNTELNLSELIYRILGNYAGRIAAAFCFIWIFILLVLYVRYYAERITASIFPNSSMQFFVINMLILVFFVLRDGMVPLTRLNEVLFLIFMGAVALFFILGIPNIRIENLWPVTYRDAMPVMQAAYYLIAIWGYYFFMFFFDIKIKDKEKIKKTGAKGMAFLCAAGTLIIIMCVGSMGAGLTERVNLPFIFTIKIISVADMLERLESIILSLWVATDFLIITVFSYILMSIIKSFFKLGNTKYFAAPVVLALYVMCFWFANNRFELRNFTNYFAVGINAIFTFAFPVFLWIIGKIRKVI